MAAAPTEVEAKVAFHCVAERRASLSSLAEPVNLAAEVEVRAPRAMVTVAAAQRAAAVASASAAGVASQSPKPELRDEVVGSPRGSSP